MQSVDMAARAVWGWIVRYHQGVDRESTVIDLKVLILSRHLARDIEVFFLSSFTTPLLARAKRPILGQFNCIALRLGMAIRCMELGSEHDGLQDARRTVLGSSDRVTSYEQHHLLSYVKYLTTSYRKEYKKSTHYSISITI